MTKDLESLFKTYTGCPPVSVKALAGAGSNRKYFRLSGKDGSVIGVIGDDVEENKAFCTIARHFKAKNINVPEVYAVSADSSCYLQEDLGNLSLFDAVAGGRETGAYSAQEEALLLKTVALLPDIQFRGAEGFDFSNCYPESSFGRRIIISDLNYFKFCFLKTTGLEYNEALLDEDFMHLADDLIADCPDTFLYRDFQARNVMLKDGKPYFIDFQGGRCGPFYYDLASFVWQAKARYPEELKEKMISVYKESLARYIRVDDRVFRDRLRLFVLLRTLQVLGAYGFRGYFERKPHFLTSIPFAIANLRGMLPVPEYPVLDKVLGELVMLPKFAAGTATPLDRKTGGIQVYSMEGETGEKPGLTVDVCSFSFKKGLPDDASGNGGGYIFDCRSIHNPGRYDRYKGLTGKDREVIDFLETDGEVFGYMDHVYGIVDPHVETFLRRGFTHLMVGFGCTGGQHRSVYCAESLARHLRGKYDIDVILTHREQSSWPGI